MADPAAAHAPVAADAAFPGGASQITDNLAAVQQLEAQLRAAIHHLPGMRSWRPRAWYMGTSANSLLVYKYKREGVLVTGHWRDYTEWAPPNTEDEELITAATLHAERLADAAADVFNHESAQGAFSIVLDENGAVVGGLLTHLTYDGEREMIFM